MLRRFLTEYKKHRRTLGLKMVFWLTYVKWKNRKKKPKK